MSRNKKITDEDFLTSVYDPKLSNSEMSKKAKENLGVDIHRTNISRAITRLKKAGLIEIDTDNTIHSNEVYRGRTTTFYERDEDGKVDKIHHLKVDANKENVLEEFIEAIERLSDKVQPIDEIDRIMSPSLSVVDMENVYISTDLHIGLLADSNETRNRNWDINTAVKTIMSSIDFLVENSPNTETALIVDIGDIVESDNFSNQTLRSGNPLDVDGRWSSVMEIAMYLTSYMVKKCLEKHGRVKWMNVPGNHDDHSSLAIMWYLKGLFSNNDRVVIDDGRQLTKYHRFGKNLVGINHGNMLKPKNAGELMCFDNESIWSETVNRYMYMGHRHADAVYTGPLCKVESFNNLAPLNAWAATAYRGPAGTMNCVTLHAEYGEINRVKYNVMMGDKDGD